MFCPHCGGEIAANNSTWTCGKCQRTYSIIEHRFGKQHTLVAGEIEWNYDPKLDTESKKERPTEGWCGFVHTKNYHYFVEGRSLCRNWGFPNYDDMTPDTGNSELVKGDCAACFRKLLKRRKELGVTKIEWKSVIQNTAQEMEGKQ